MITTMKNITFILLLTLTLTWSCKPDNLHPYQGENAIKFAHSETGQDSVLRTFRSTAANELIISQVIEITGEITDYARPYKLVVDAERSSAVSGKDFEVLLDTFSIAPHANKDTVTLKLRKTPALNDRELSIVLQLLPNEHFKLLHDTYRVNDREVRFDRYRINFSNHYIIGPNWDTSILGKFSQKKLRLLQEITQLDLLKFYVLWGYYPSHYLSFARTFSAYLRNQKAAGNIIYDEENNEEMQMGSNI